MKTLRSSLLATPPVAVGVFVVVVLLGGCGGGGGTSPGGGGTPPSSSVFSDASRGVVANPMILRLASTNLFSGSRSRQYDTCPRYTFSFSGNSVTMDFGSGCYSSEFGGRVWGRITATVVNPRYDSDGELVDLERIDMSLVNLGSESEGTYNGTLSFRNVGRDDALGFDFDLRLRRQCEERLQFRGTVTYREGWFDDYLTFRGSGVYQAPAIGSVRFNMDELTYNVYGGCDYPVAGRLSVSAGGATATAYFDTGSCGYARITDEVSSDVVNLTAIDFNPCR